MFTFLNSSLLVGLLAAAIPLIIHLLTRQKVKKVFFSSLIFLRELKTEKIKRIKIRQILLLIIRTLIVLLLVLAFTRPTLKSKLSSATQSQAKTSAVVIFDHSLSMGRESDSKLLIDEARDRFKELAELFSVGDEIYALYLTTGASAIYDGPRYDFNSVIKSISNISISNSATDIVTALVEAKNILQTAKNLNKEIYLISDLQQTGFEKLQDISSPLLDGTNIKLFVIPCSSEKISNLGVVQVKSANQIIEKDKVFELTVVVKNFGNYEERNKLVQLFIEGKRSAQGSVNLKPGESQKLSFKIVPDKTGLLTGSVLLEDDELLLDNRRYFTFYVPDKINVLLAGKGVENTRFLKLAADISPNIEINEIDLNQINYNSLNDHQVVILSNIAQLNNTFIAELFNFVEGGGGLIVFLGSDVDLKNYNANLNQKFSLPTFTETVGDINNRNSFLTVGKVDYSHPIFKGMFEEKPEELESPNFYFAVKVKSNSQAENIIELSNGSPLLTETQIGKGKTLLFLTATDPNWSDFYIKGLFVPLINRSIIYLAGVAERADRELLVDQGIQQVVYSTNEFTNFKVEKPDGSFERMKPEIDQAAYKIIFKQTNLMGIYTLFSNDKPIDKWAVNHAAIESDIEPLPEKKLKELVGADHVTISDRNRTIKNDVLITRYGRELWKYLIAVALVLLLVEMIIARESRTVESV